MNPYHTVTVRHSKGEPFRIEFGSYHYAEAASEADDLAYQYGNTNVRIITTDDGQPSIEAALNKLNS